MPLLRAGSRVYEQQRRPHACTRRSRTEYVIALAMTLASRHPLQRVGPFQAASSPDSQASSRRERTRVDSPVGAGEVHRVERLGSSLGAPTAVEADPSRPPLVRRTLRRRGRRPRWGTNGGASQAMDPPRPPSCNRVRRISFRQNRQSRPGSGTSRAVDRRSDVPAFWTAGDPTSSPTPRPLTITSSA